MLDAVTPAAHEPAPASRPDNVWAGDIDRINSTSRFVPTRRWMFAIGLASLAWPAAALIERRSSAEVLGFGLITLGAVFIGVAGMIELVRHGNLADLETGRKRDAHGWTKRAAPDAIQVGHALTLWREALPRSTGRLRFDVARYLELAGPAGPRVLALGDLPPPVPIPSDVFEEVDMGVDRAMSPAHRRGLWFGLLGLSILIALQTLLARPFIGLGFDLNTLFLAVLLGYMFVRLRLFPIRLGGASAVIGEYADRPLLGLLPLRRFTRADSVLLLHELRASGQGDSLQVAFLRRDGAQRWIIFAEGWNDPAFQQLLARWCYRPPPTPSSHPQ